MKCLICGGENIKSLDTIVSDFVMDRISPEFSQNRVNKKVKLCFCNDCTFAFYDYRFTPEEESLLYRDYRGSEYQKQREKFECWYTPKVNAAINSGDAKAQQQRIEHMLSEHIDYELRTALDYGGNRGETFTPMMGTTRKYVYDISGVKPIQGVVPIDNMAELHRLSFDFIMCNMVFEHLSDPLEVIRTLGQLGDAKTVYYIEVPSENPFIKGNKFSIWKNLALLLNPNYNWFRLVKYYFQQRKQPFMPMKEHINFFTAKSIRFLAEKNDFDVIDVEEIEGKTPKDSGAVLAMLFRKHVIS